MKLLIFVLIATASCCKPKNEKPEPFDPDYDLDEDFYQFEPAIDDQERNYPVSFSLLYSILQLI
jgi:hypothetical protein